MLIESILNLDRAKANVEGISKKRVIETLAKIFANDIDGFNVDDIYQYLINREKLGTTGIGGGIAIPHCRFKTMGKTYCACMTLKSPIDFDSVDNEPVDIIFAMLVPENAENNHLELLAGLAEMLQKSDFIGKLRQATTDSELFNIAVKEN